MSKRVRGWPWSRRRSSLNKNLPDRRDPDPPVTLVAVLRTSCLIRGRTDSRMWSGGERTMLVKTTNRETWGLRVLPNPTPTPPLCGEDRRGSDEDGDRPPRDVPVIDLGRATRGRRLSLPSSWRGGPDVPPGLWKVLRQDLFPSSYTARPSPFPSHLLVYRKFGCLLPI